MTCYNLKRLLYFSPLQSSFDVKQQKMKPRRYTLSKAAIPNNTFVGQVSLTPIAAMLYGFKKAIQISNISLVQMWQKLYISCLTQRMKSSEYFSLQGLKLFKSLVQSSLVNDLNLNKYANPRNRMPELIHQKNHMHSMNNQIRISFQCP